MKKDEIIAKYVAKYGKQNAQSILNWLGKQRSFIEAISTELGQEIMSIHIDAADESFNKLRSLLSKVEDITKLNVKTILAQAEYNVCLKLITDVQGRINKYNKYSSDLG